jgi:hypothetical protein
MLAVALHHAPEAAVGAGATGVGAGGVAVVATGVGAGVAGIGVVGLGDRDGERLGDGGEEVGATDVGAVMTAAVVLLDDEHEASPAASTIKPVRTAKFLMVSPLDTYMTLRPPSWVTRAWCLALTNRSQRPGLKITTDSSSRLRVISCVTIATVAGVLRRTLADDKTSP